MTAVKRTMRMLLIIELLQERPHSVDELADRCGVDARTIRRDLLDLQGEPKYAPLMVRHCQEWSILKAG